MFLQFFKKRRFKKDARILHDALIKALEPVMPELAENNKHWKYNGASRHNVKAGIRFWHSCSELKYYEKHKKRNRKLYNIHNIGIRRIDGDIIKFKAKITFNLLSIVEFTFEEPLSKMYKLTEINVSSIYIEPIEYEDPDVEKVKKILKNYTQDLLEMLDLDESFEIELDEKKFYTILNMEDGNYIGINSKGSVFRLLHDAGEPAKKIAKNIEELLIGYEGYKGVFEKYFDS